MARRPRILLPLVIATLAAAPATRPVDPAVETRALAYEIAQRKEPDRRAAGVARAAALLVGDDARGQLIAIAALRNIADVKFDREPIADALRRLLRAATNDEARAGALAALPSNGGGPRDLDLIVACAADPSPRVRAAAPAAFVACNENQGGATFDALLLKLLDDADANVRVEAMRATHDVPVGPAVEARLVALSRDAKFERDAIVLGLTTRPLVRPPVAARLIEVIGDPALSSLAERCAWGLRVDVAPDARPAVDAALLRLLDESIDTNVRVNCINALGRSPDLNVIAQLATLAADATEADRVRDAARRAANLGQ